MSIESAKLLILEKVLKTNNAKMLDQILQLVKSEDEDFWDDLTPYQKYEINESIQELNEGKRVPYEKVMKKYRK